MTNVTSTLEGKNSHVKGGLNCILMYSEIYKTNLSAAAHSTTLALNFPLFVVFMLVS